jgi:hypothetical protein
LTDIYLLRYIIYKSAPIIGERRIAKKALVRGLYKGIPGARDKYIIIKKPL